MKTSFVSSLAVSTALRYSMGRMQAELVKAQKEVVTGRVADSGLALGVRTGHSVSLARDIQRLSGVIDSNALVSARLSASQGALGQLSSLAESFRSTLTASFSGGTDPAIARTAAAETLETMTSLVNSSLNGEYLFAGTNTDVRPINPYAGSPAKTAFDNAFLTYFGFTQADPAAASITAAQVEDFLDTAVQPQFLTGDWQNNWSNATDEQITSRIALNETAATSVGANNTGMRKLAMASVAVQEMLRGPLAGGAQRDLMERMTILVTEAIDEIDGMRAQLGLVEGRVSAANERLEMQVDLFTRNVHDLEGVDPYEASTKLSSLLAQIETSYSLTARIQQLSLLRYLS
jgi:flagellar hook-associated protein 3 FlgL